MIQTRLVSTLRRALPLRLSSLNPLTLSVSRSEARHQTLATSTRPSRLRNMADVQKMCDDKIAGKKVMVFSKTYCPFCTKAKAALKKLIESGELSSEDIEYMEIENNPQCEQIQQYMQKKTGGRSVPRVFIKGQFIGGGDETVAKQKSGELAKLIKG